MHARVAGPRFRAPDAAEAPSADSRPTQARGLTTVTTRPELAAEHRDVTGKKVAGLRRQGKLPAVVYGHGNPSQSIQLDAREFGLLRRRIGRNTLVDLRVGTGRPTPVLLHAVHEHPVTRLPLHADFFIVRMTEELSVEVPVSLTGESYAVERLGGTLLHMRETVQVRALPSDLPSVLELDVTSLDSFEVSLHASDLQIPPRVTLLTDPSELVARVIPPRVTEVEHAAPVEEEGAAPTEEAAAEAEAAPGS
jgi:large subunit ribosomal protein L25